MPGEIDPVILQLRADVARYESELRRTTRTVDQQLGRQGARVQKLEAEFRRSSGAISGTLKGLAATLATAFTGRELAGLLDSFTRFQNQLRVAGLEGESLLRVQERLREIGRTYGADLESLGSTFSRIAQVQGDLGASTEDIIRLNEIVAASLKVAGTDAQTASGALLQLGQAFGSGVVRAEEFNSILEGALPLAQAAARGIDGYGGSVAKLRADIAEGNVTSKQFFEGVLKGGIQTLEDAESATLTLSGAVTGLRNELVVYFGEAGQGAGATEALATAIQTLADNLDTIIPILAALATLLGVRLVAGAIAAQGALAGTAAQMGVVGAASFALQARLAGAATSMQALRFAGSGLAAAFGGPVGLAVTALATGFIYLAANSETAAQKLDRLTQAAEDAERTADTYEQRLRDAGIAVDGLGEASDGARGKVVGLTGAMREASNEALRLIRNLQLANFLKASNELSDVRAQRVAAEGALGRAQQGLGRPGETGGFAGISGSTPGSIDANTRQARAEVARLRAQENGLVRQLRAIAVGAINNFDVTAEADAPGAGGGSGGGGGSKGGGSGRTTVTDPAETRRRFDDQLDAIRSRVASAELQLATSIEERAELELRQVEAARRQALRALEAEDEYSDEQRERLRLGIENVAAAERLAIEFQKQAEIEQRNRDLAEERGRAQLDALRLQLDLADTDDERRAIALRLLAAEDELLRSRLESIIASETALEADKERARIALAALNDTAQARTEATNRQYEGALTRYARGTQDVNARVEEAAVRRIEQLNETIADAMTNALGIEDPFLRDLIGIFLDKNIFGPLAEALSGAGGGGDFFSTIGTAIASIFGRASGGPVNAGQIYRVNEGSSPGRVEAFVPNTSGQIIPLGRMNAMQAGGQSGGGVSVVRLALSDDIDARIERVSGPVAIEVVKQSSGPLIDAAANETLRRAQRPTL